MYLQGCNIYSKIVHVGSYHLITVAFEDLHETAITIPFGLFKFTRMSFGLRNTAKKKFQRFMDEAL